MGVVDDIYVPSRQKTEEAELDAWTGVKPLPHLTIAPPDLSLTMTPKGPADTSQGTAQQSQRFQTQHAAVEAGAATTLLGQIGAMNRAIVDVEGLVIPDVQTGLHEAPKQMLGGARDAISQFLGALESLQEWNTQRSEALLGNVQSRPTTKLSEALPTVGEAESTTGALIRSASQFMTAFIPATIATGPLASVSPFLQASVAGALTDATAFDPNSRRISELINTLAPALRNPITTYLAGSPDDTEAEKRLKAALEGLGIGTAAAGLLRAAKAIKASRAVQTLIEDERGSVRLPSGGETPKPPTPGESVSGSVTTPPVSQPGQVPRDMRAEAFASPGRFNPARQIAPESLTDLTAAINVRARDAGIMERQTRGYQSWPDTDKKANALVVSGEMSVERILGLRPGDVLNAEEGLAARNIRDAVVAQLDALMGMADRGDEVAKTGLEQAAIFASRIETNVEAATGTEIARALAVRRRASLAYDNLDDIYHRLLQRTIDPEVLYQFYKQLTDKTQREAFTKYLETTSAKQRWINAFLEARAAGFLTIRSLERNILGSGAATIWSIPERAVTAVLGTVRGTTEGAYAHEAASLMYGMYQSQRTVMSMVWQALKTGESQFIEGASQGERQFLPAISADALNLSGPLGRFVDILGEVIRLPFRGLVAGDDYMKFTNYTAEKYALAYREYRQLLQHGESRANAANAHAQLIMNPPPWLDQAAREHALYTTFNDEVINPVGQAILAIRNNDGPTGQLARYFLPFARTPMNVMGYGAERTPVLNVLSSHYWQEIQAGGVRKDAAYARLALGSGVMALFSVLAANGYINGKGPRDPKLRKMYQDAGWKPYSINLPGRNPIPFLGLSPLSEVIGQAADFGEMVNQGADDMTLAKLAGAMVLSTAHVMEEYPMLKGLADIHEAIQTWSQRSEGIIQEVLKGVMPVPGFSGIARTISELSDPNLRETRSPQGGGMYPGTLGYLSREVSALWEEMAAATPWLQNYQHPKRDILGRPLLRQGGWWVLAANAPSAQSPHPVIAELIKHQVAVGLPTKAFGVGKQVLGVMDDASMDVGAVTLSADEWARYQELAGSITLASGIPSPHGRTLAEELSHLIASPAYQREADGPFGGKASELKLTFREYREAAKDRLLQEQRINGKPGPLEVLLEQKERLQEFKRLSKAQQDAVRPALERDLGRRVNIGILR